MRLIFLKYLFFATLFLFLFPSSAHAAKLTLEPTDLTITSGQQFEVNLSLDTEGRTVNALDVVVIYPHSLVWIDKVDYPTYFPFHIQDITEEEGRVILHFGADSQNTRFNGKGLLATFTLSTHADGEAYLSFVCDNSDDWDDTNVWEADTAEDIVDCGQLHKGIYHINPKVGGVAEPSPSPVCVAPGAPGSVWGESGPAAGQATLHWQSVDNANYYTITYGLSSGGYIYGAPNIGAGTQYTISQLTPGRVYYFVLTAVNSCGSSGYSKEVAVRSGGSLPQKQPETKGGWQPGDVITFSPLPLVSPLVSPSPEEEEPTEEPGEATASATPEPEEEEASPTPTAFIPEKEEPFWRNWNFWVKAGLLSLGLFIALIVVSSLIGKLKGRKAPPASAGKVKQEAKDEWPPPEAPSEEKPAAPEQWPPPEKSA